MANEIPGPGLQNKAQLRPAAFDELAGWRRDNHQQTWSVFVEHCRAITGSLTPLRAGAPASTTLVMTCGRALTLETPETNMQARLNFESLFTAHEILPLAVENPYDSGFLTGYYEPVVAGSLTPTPDFSEPVLGRPPDLINLTPDNTPAGFPTGLASARRKADGSLEPFPDRAAIENAGAVSGAPPLLWVRDGIELFMIQVQGSARIRLPDGRLIRLTYAGRNGLPYSSIGKLMVERGHVPSAELTLARLKEWVRENGQEPGEAGRMLMQENRSYVFFKVDDTLSEDSGPVGAASIPLTPLRSIAVDRTLWPYGLPMWIDAKIPWRRNELQNFRRLMIAQDTGSAIIGAARADLFFGTGEKAGRLAAGIRHRARMFVLLPRESEAGQ